MRKSPGGKSASGQRAGASKGEGKALRRASLEKWNSDESESSSGDEDDDENGLVQLGGTKLERADRIAVGTYHTVLCTRFGRVFTYGWGQHGRLGHGDQLDRFAPHILEFGIFRRERLPPGREAHEYSPDAPAIEIVQVAAGTSHSMFLSANAEAYTCGHGGGGRLGHGREDMLSYPLLVPVMEVEAGLDLDVDGPTPIWILPDRQEQKEDVGAERVSKALAEIKCEAKGEGEGEGGKNESDAAAAHAPGAVPAHLIIEKAKTQREVAEAERQRAMQLMQAQKQAAAEEKRKILARQELEEELKKKDFRDIVSLARAAAARAAANQKPVFLGGRRVARPPMRRVKVASVSAGRAISGFISEHGTLLLCGAGNKGQLGHGGTENRLVPTDECMARMRARDPNVRVEMVALGAEHTLILTDAGKLWACGSNRWNKLGLALCDKPAQDDLSGSDEEGTAVAAASATRTGFGRAVRDIDGTGSGGLGNALWLVADTTCHCLRRIEPNGDAITLAGSGAPGKKDAWSTAAQFHCPAGLRFSKRGAILVADAGNHCDRSVSREGYRVETLGYALVTGMVGWDGAPVSRTGEILAPAALGAVADEKRLGARIIHIAAGDEHSILLTEQGAVFTWGYGGSGRLGHGDESSRFIPTPVPNTGSATAGRSTNEQIIRVSAGTCHSALLTLSGQVLTFGEGEAGQLGIGYQCAAQLTAAAMPELDEHHVADLSHMGMGDGEDSDSDIDDGGLGTIDAGGASSVCQLACGDSHTAMISSRDTLWTTGWEPDLEERQLVPTWKAFATGIG